MSRENLASMIRSKTSLYGDATAMYFKEGSEWQEISYLELGKRIENLAGGLLELGVEPGDRVGIMAQNSPEWAIADFAIQSVGGITVPIYATNTAGQAQYITNDAGLKVLFAGSAEEREKIETFVETSTIERVVMLDGSPFEPSTTMLSFSDLLAKGRDARRSEELERILTGINEEDVATIIYTSGTTGEPKGVMLTHGNFYHQFHAMEGWFSVTPEDRSLSFLPLSHVYERTWSYYVFHQGAQNGYVRDPK